MKFYSGWIIMGPNPGIEPIISIIPRPSRPITYYDPLFLLICYSLARKFSHSLFFIFLWLYCFQDLTLDLMIIQN